jgi:DNA-binding transcriptional MerR regulator
MTTFDRTTGQVAREAGVSQPTVRLYANLGLLPHVVASDGTRLFPAEAADRAREICAERLSHRGRSRSQAAA